VTERDADVHAAHLLGVALWAPRLPGWSIAESVLRGEVAAPDQPASRPSPSVLAATERRRAPDTVAIALEVAARACESAGIGAGELASVFACSEGDVVINDYMSETLARTPLLISPIRFHNSVHNAAAGYWTIGTGCMQPYTALSARHDTFGEGLLEALVQAEADGKPTLLVAYDIESRGPLATMAPTRGIVGAAVVVAPGEGVAPATGLRWRTARGVERTVPLERNAGLVAGNAMAPCLPFFEAVARREPCTVRLGLSPSMLLELDFQFSVHKVRQAQ
jgi:Beta-ketoacyl synthase, N-terminal domain